MLGALAVVPAARAQVELLAEVRLRGAILPDTTVGGIDETLAEWSDSASVSDSFHDRESGGELVSDATHGFLQGSIFSQIYVPGTFTRGAPFAQMYVRQIDTYTVGAGTSGLSNGDPVQVRIEAFATMTLVLVGAPSASSELVFNVVGVPGVTGRWVDWHSGLLGPPQDLEIEEYWEIVVDTTVGASFTLESNLEATIGTTSFTGPMEEPERSDATGFALVRVSPARGFEGVDITTDAGASTSPIRAVPILSPPGLVGLIVGLSAAGLLVLRRRA
jgi:hypothetical protein